MNRTHTSFSNGDTLQFSSHFNVDQNLENIQLIWCDACCIDTDNLDVQYTKGMLTGLNVQTHFFGNIDQCIEHIKSTDNTIRIILIVSGSFALNVLSDVHSCRSISFIFIYCEHDEKYQSLLSEYNKTVNIFTRHESLRSSICEKLDLLEKQTFQFTVFNQEQKSIRDLTERTLESFVFLFYSVQFNILKRMAADEHAKEHLIDTCSSVLCDSKYDLTMIEHFRTTFKADDAIKWYTKNCFLFRLLNRALRTETLELLFAFRFFIIVLCDALKNEKQKLPQNTLFTLFRGQKMTRIEFNRLREKIGGFITTNGFLSTSTDVDVALMFAGYGAEHPETLCIVLFEIQANSDVESVIFAPIEGDSNFIDEKEVLFSLNAVFQIESIDFDEQYQVWKVRMSATDKGSKYLDEFLEASVTMEKKKLYTPLMFYGHVLWHEFQQLDKAKEYFQNLTKTLPIDHPDSPIIYYELGCICQKKEQLIEALDNLKHAQDLLCNEKSERMALIWHVMAKVYYDQADFDQSLDYSQRALTIWNSNIEHIEKAQTIEYMAKAYQCRNTTKYYDQILDYYYQALAIYQRLAPAKNDNITKCLERIAHFYDMNGKFDLGLEKYKQAASSGLYSPYESVDKFLVALNPLMEKFKRRVEKFGTEQTLGPTFLLLHEMINFRIRTLGEDEDHPAIAILIGNMAHLCEQTESIPKIAYYELAISKLESNTQRDGLTTTMLDFIDKLYWIYMQLEQYDNAMRSIRRKLAIQQEYYLPTNIEIVRTWYQMGNLHQCIRSHPSEIIDCYIQGLKLYESIERPENTQYLRDVMTQMLRLEMTGLDSLTFSN